MIIGLTSVLVDDQDKALKFYTEKLGFELKRDMPLGNEAGDRWLTLVSPEGAHGVELLLEPSSNSLARDFQQALFEQGISGGQFNSSDIQAEYDRLSERGVEFTMTPTDIGPAIMAVFKDTCGNFITLVQEKVG